MRRFWLTVAAVFLAVPALAQTPVFQLQWTHTEDVATVQTFSYTYTVDGGNPITLEPACVTAGTGSRCTAALAPIQGDGEHTLILTAWNGFGSAASDPLVGSAPNKPTAVTITVTIQIGG